MNYAEVIKESESDLLQLEKREKNAMRRDRIRFIRMLKTGQFRSQSSAGAATGLGERQSQRLWSSYVKGGIAGYNAEMIIKTPSIVDTRTADQ